MGERGKVWGRVFTRGGERQGGRVREGGEGSVNGACYTGDSLFILIAQFIQFFLPRYF